jgi:hypothetical protein
MIRIVVRGNIADLIHTIVRAQEMPPGVLAGNRAGRSVARSIARVFGEKLLNNPPFHNQLVGLTMRHVSILFAFVVLAPPWLVQLMPPFNHLTISQTKNESQS